MNSTSRPNRINIDLQGYKQPWLDYCRAHGVTPSEAFRQVVAKLTAQTPSAHPVAERLPQEGAKIRKELRLTISELRRAESLVARDGFSLNRWVVALIDARLDGQPQLGQQELEVLARSNLNLLAIGRNLNQLTRAANSRLPGVGPHSAPAIVALNRVVMEHSLKVAAGDADECGAMAGEVISTVSSSLVVGIPHRAPAEDVGRRGRGDRMRAEVFKR